jgi:Flp pilus assembly protein TadD
MASALEQAVACQKAGRLTEAEDIYRRILAAEPDHPEALHWLGVLALQRGDPHAAATLIGRASPRTSAPWRCRRMTWTFRSTLRSL